ncbi:hypothetical protein [Corallococcus sp. AS-1-6]|uniref:hypothetical protein n=1 Tax=Corallococcus sp. AS-1-6 TaxID=2874599 RepID=UPI001CBA95E9|nr:hypothetical protein [Corallococcus sp. AS-1-6]MBZ4371446.1 hypothetical protein [Corallococcus sp. AS-1-6]
MSRKRGARSAPRSTSSTTATEGVALVRAAFYDELARAAHDVCDALGVEAKSPGRDAMTRLLEAQDAVVTTEARNEAELKSLRQQLATVQALVRGAAEAFDGTPTGQVLDGLLLQMQAVTKGGAR